MHINTYSHLRPAKEFRIENLARLAMASSKDRESYLSMMDDTFRDSESLSNSAELCELDMILCANKIIELRAEMMR